MLYRKVADITKTDSQWQKKIHPEDRAYSINLRRKKNLDFSEPDQSSPVVFSWVENQPIAATSQAKQLTHPNVLW